MEFKVPQSLEIEDQLFGPFTTTQFIYLVGGVGLAYLLWTYLPTFLSLIFILPVAGVTWGLVFFPEHRFGQTFAKLMEAAFSYISSPKLYLWHKRERKKEEMDFYTKKTHAPKKEGDDIPRISQNNLKDLSNKLQVSSPVEEETKDVPGSSEHPLE